MVLSKTCNHALRAALYVARVPERKYVPIKEIAEKLGISFHFLTKILQTLTHQGIFHSFKGPNGGVALARPAGDISLIEIIAAIDGSALLHDCLLGLKQCSDNYPCPVHAQWRPIRDQLQALFADTNLQQLANKVSADGHRLTDAQDR